MNDLGVLRAIQNRDPGRDARVLRDRTNPFDYFSGDDFVRRNRFTKEVVWEPLGVIRADLEPTVWCVFVAPGLLFISRHF